MKTSIKVIATVLAASIATSSMAAPASAFFGPPHFFWFKKFYIHKPYVPEKKTVIHRGHGAPKLLLACIFGSAFGLIGASLAKKTGQLTIDEAQAIAFTCGLGAFPVMANFQAPAPAVKAKY